MLSQMGKAYESRLECAGGTRCVVSSKSILPSTLPPSTYSNLPSPFFSFKASSNLRRQKRLCALLPSHQDCLAVSGDCCSAVLATEPHNQILKPHDQLHLSSHPLSHLSNLSESTEIPVRSPLVQLCCRQLIKCPTRDAHKCLRASTRET